jgi:hypothetical protein
MLWLLRLIYKRLENLLQLSPFYCYIFQWSSTPFHLFDLGSGERSGYPFLALRCFSISTVPPGFWVNESCCPLPYQLPSTDPLLRRRRRGCATPMSRECRCNSQVILILSDGAGCGTCVAPHPLHLLTIPSCSHPPSSPRQIGAVCSSALPKHQTIPVMQTSMAPPQRLLTYQGLSSPWYEFPNPTQFMLL